MDSGCPLKKLFNSDAVNKKVIARDSLGHYTLSAAGKIVVLQKNCSFAIGPIHAT